MKRGKAIKRLAVLLAVTFTINAMNVITSFAGASDMVVDKSSFAEELSTTKWSNPVGDVVAEKGILIFPEESTAETRLITTIIAQKSEELEELFHASASLKLTTLPENEKFAFAFGLQSIESYQGEAGNVEITFSNQGGLNVEVIAYNESGEAVAVVEPVKLGSRLHTNIKISVVVSADSKLTLQINNKQLCNQLQLPVTGEGSIGFVQTGNCGAQVSDINIVTHKYDTPENCNIDENFDNGSMNINVLSSKTQWASPYYPHSLSVMEHDDNQVLMFERCGCAYVATRYEYSNFEMTFDVPYLQREEVRDEKENVVEPKPNNFLVSFGGDAIESTGFGYQNAADSIVFYSNSQVANKSGEHVGLDKNHKFFDPNNNKGFSVKISVIDAVVTVGLKWMNEDKYSTVLQYTLPNGTPQGYIHIWSTDVGNFAVDNLKIINKDKNPKLIEVEYKSGKVERIADFDYKETEMVFQEIAEEASFNWYSITLYALIAGVVILIAGFVTGQIVRKKRNKVKQGGDSREV